MKTSTGLIGVLLAVGALALSSAHSKTAEAHSSARPSSATDAASVSTTSVASSVVLLVPAVAASPVTVVSQAALASEPSFASLAPTLEPPAALRRMGTRELTPAMMLSAAQVVRKYYSKPVGTNVDVQVDGKHLVARIERHYHPEGGAIKPWGFHPGVSLFAIR